MFFNKNFPVIFHDKTYEFLLIQEIKDEIAFFKSKFLLMIFKWYLNCIVKRSQKEKRYPKSFILSFSIFFISEVIFSDEMKDSYYNS